MDTDKTKKIKEAIIERKEQKRRELPVPAKFEKIPVRGLKRLRAKTGKTPEYDCSNCKCKRYSPCGCEKKG